MPFRGLFFCILSQLVAVATGAAQSPPYPPSQAITGLTWHWDTRQTAALGSDLWPVTWGPDDHLYLSWGDGGGFGGGDHDGRVAMGIARIEGGPEHFRGFNVNGGKNPEHPASFPKKGKTGGLIFDQGILYASINLQDGKWPDISHVIAWSTNKGATWAKADWLFPKGAGHFHPARFINFGKDGAGVPDSLAGYLYLFGCKLEVDEGKTDDLYLVRVPRGKASERIAYEFFSGLAPNWQTSWQRELSQARPIFTDTNGVAPAGMVYAPALGRYLLTTFRAGCQLGVFESRQPWGPWRTVAYYSDWGNMGMDAEGLTCEFPQKWMSADGSTLWCIFSVYGDGAKKGIVAHDRFNLVKVTLSLAAEEK